MDQLKLTSVKVLQSLYNKFKIVTVNSKMSLQKVTNRTIHLYLTDDEFRNKLNNLDNLTISGSNL
jgi:hypothetical protein